MPLPVDLSETHSLRSHVQDFANSLLKGSLQRLDYKSYGWLSNNCFMVPALTYAPLIVLKALMIAQAPCMLVMGLY